LGHGLGVNRAGHRKLVVALKFLERVGTDARFQGRCTRFGPGRYESQSLPSPRNTPGGNQLTTKLDNPLKRELSILGRPYTLTLSPQGLALAPKGRRKGYELAWVDLVSGDAALAVALNASLARGPKPDTAQPKASSIKPTASAKRSARTPRKRR
jgi:hypothetical protein